jgi:hypothetical protein
MTRAFWAWRGATASDNDQRARKNDARRVFISLDLWVTMNGSGCPIKVSDLLMNILDSLRRRSDIEDAHGYVSI